MGLPKAHRKRTAAFVAAFCLVAGLVVNVAAAASPAMSASLGQERSASAVRGGSAAGNGGSQWGTGTLSAPDLHALVSQMTLSEEVGMVHGEGDPPSSAAARMSWACRKVSAAMTGGWVTSSDQIHREASFHRILVTFPRATSEELGNDLPALRLNQRHGAGLAARPVRTRGLAGLAGHASPGREPDHSDPSLPAS